MARLVTLGMLNVSLKVVSIEERRADILRMVEDAGKGGCQIVLIPEFADHHRTHESHANYGKVGIDEYRKVVGLRYDSPFMTALAALARRHNMVVIPDVMLLDQGRASNTCVVYGPEGSVLGTYSKVHLAPGECDMFEGGTQIAPVATPYGKLGLLICYDINFPELTRCYELMGAELLLWTTMRQAELEDGLYRARLPGRCMDHGLPLGAATYVSEDQLLMRASMSSVVYNSLGQVAGGGLMTPGVVRGTVDLDAKPLERRSWANPEWLDSASYLRRFRRPELYGVISRPLTKEEANPDNEPTLIPRTLTKFQSLG
jgi:predicted amidohydrolase